MNYTWNKYFLVAWDTDKSTVVNCDTMAKYRSTILSKIENAHSSLQLFMGHVISLAETKDSPKPLPQESIHLA